MGSGTIQKQTILIVDDDAQARTAMGKALAQAGFKIYEASSDKEGIRQSHVTRPDLVITDLFMPEKGGIEMIKQLKDLFPDIKIIVISGGCYVGPEPYLRIAMNLGVSATLKKPIERKMLLRKVEEVLFDSVSN